MSQVTEILRGRLAGAESSLALVYKEYSAEYGAGEGGDRVVTQLAVALKATTRALEEMDLYLGRMRAGGR